jgi:hypothetical protein
MGPLKNLYPGKPYIKYILVEIMISAKIALEDIVVNNIVG